MRPIKSRRANQRPACAPAQSPQAAGLRYRYRPRLELLENRLPLGDTILGLWAVALGGLGSLSHDAPHTINLGAHEKSGQQRRFAILETAGSQPAVSLRLYSGIQAAVSPAGTAPAASTPRVQKAVDSFPPNGLEDEALTGRMALHRLTHSTALPAQAAPVSPGVAAAEDGTSAQGGGSNPAVAPASGKATGPPAQLQSAAAALSFNRSTGQLAIRTGAGQHTVREETAPDGFVDVTVDGQDHSSNPRSASFDSALSGTTTVTMAGIRFGSGGQESLILGSQHLADGFTVQAAGGNVVTQDVATTGTLAIQASNITVSGALRGGSIVLTASGWVTVQATGAIDAAGPAAGGFIEMSGNGNLSYGGSADAGAPSGMRGTLLLDLKNITISAAPAGVFPQFDLIDPHPTAGGDFGTAITGLKVLSNGNVVVTNPNDDFGGLNAGAAYLFDGSSGALISSLVGSNPGDQVGLYGVTPLSNGNFVIDSPFWNQHRGAATWADGSTGLSGAVYDANSLVGTNPNDDVGLGNAVALMPGLVALSNGNYLVPSPYWNGRRGAVTWANGSTGIAGIVSDANSLVGSNPGDMIGARDTLLSNGNYVASSSSWNGQRGAVTWGDATMGIRGVVSDTNSLVGGNSEDQVGRVIPLSNGNYLVQSESWNDGRGAITWGNGNTGTSGPVSDANSLVGSTPGDEVGLELGPTSVVELSSGNYVVRSPYWNDHRGAETWVSGTTGQTLDGVGAITPQNSLIGTFPFNITENPVDQVFLVALGGRVTAGFTDPNQLTYGLAQSQSLTITPDFLSRALDTGTGVVLQASNDITVNSPITVSAAGNGGALTLQAGRSMLLNASISTDNGPLTLIANDQLANGVVDSQRDPGNAVITMASGTRLDTGSGTLTVELRDGAGLTNPDSGPIFLGDSGLSLVVGAEPPLGSSFEIVTNAGSSSINGTFAGLTEGAIFTQGGYQFQITYQGGTGGDSIVLTRLE
jgi:hypothetical protein